MENNDYVSDDTDGHRNNPGVHYRHYLNRNGTPVVICVQDFDYPDYDATRFLSGEAWTVEHEANRALSQYAHLFGEPVDVDAVIDKYATKLEAIYVSQSAGDFTFHGVLAHFLLEVQGLTL